MVLTQKETMLIDDLKTYEKLCIEKYTKASQCACDMNLKTVFDQLKMLEQEHLKTLEQIQNGTVPNVNAQGGQQAKAKPGANDQAAYPTGCNDANKQNDQFLCQDLLSGEKHVSNVYDTCIFEFKNADVRNVLNHIQKEEQEHGQIIFDYMSKNGMYNA